MVRPFVAALADYALSCCVAEVGHKKAGEAEVHLLYESHESMCSGACMLTPCQQGQHACLHRVAAASTDHEALANF